MKHKSSTLPVWLCALLVLMPSAPAFAQLKIDNIKPRHGPHRPERTKLEFVPGDELVFTYTISGLAKTAVEGTLEAKIQSADGKVATGAKENCKETLAFAGGSTNAWYAYHLPPDAAPGKYTASITYTDTTLGKVSFERQFVVLEPTFAIVRPRFFFDPDRKIPASPNQLVGGTMFFSVDAVGFDRSAKRIDVTLSVQFHDEAGKPLRDEPLVVEQKIDDETEVESRPVISFSTWSVCNRVGTFKMKATVTDNVAKKSTTFETPIKVTE